MTNTAPRSTAPTAASYARCGCGPLECRACHANGGNGATLCRRGRRPRSRSLRRTSTRWFRSRASTRPWPAKRFRYTRSAEHPSAHVGERSHCWRPRASGGRLQAAHGSIEIAINNLFNAGDDDINLLPAPPSGVVPTQSVLRLSSATSQPATSQALVPYSTLRASVPLCWRLPCPLTVDRQALRRAVALRHRVQRSPVCLLAAC